MLDNVIGYFTDSSRRCMAEPVLDGDMVVATNSNLVVCAPLAMFYRKDWPDMESVKFPAYKAVIPEHDKDNLLFVTDAKKLLDELLILPHEKMYTSCNYCEGYGDLHTENGNKRTCKECGGDGNDEFLGVLIPTPRDSDGADDKSWLVKVKESIFSPNMLENVARLAVAAGQNMRWVLANTNGKHVLYIGDVMVLMMPMLHEYSEYNGNMQLINLDDVK
ncbi:MAG: hypothetical protein KF744_09205 [Taibaiella sp.]|nr:hypothetical protein [Taibaiella sp.]